MASKTDKSSTSGPQKNGGTSKAVPDALAIEKEQKKGDEDKSQKVTFADVQQFFKEVLIEYRKISWPERNQVLRETWSVLFLVAVITLMVLAFDWLVFHLFFSPLEHWARLHGGGFGHG